MSEAPALIPLPEELAARADQILADLPALAPVGDEDFQRNLRKVVACSEFVARLLRRDPEILLELFNSGELESPRPEKYWQELEEDLGGKLEVSDTDTSKALLRQCRQREMLRIVWRDLTGCSTLQESLADLSAMADCCIRVAVARAQAEQVLRYGVPVDDAGTEVDLVVVAMGKLGGGELNFSSDVDLIFLHESAGQTNGENSRDNADFFARVIRSAIDILQEATADGFVFRVDTRLRPFGDSGPLSMNFSQAEQYYLTHGREWERYAWIKARPVVGSGAAVEELFSFITPFVYRRYLDYGVFSAIRDMKRLIEQEVNQRSEERNLKLGRGGIREIEFIVQAMQLVRAGRERSLQEQRLLNVLPRLAKGSHLPDEVSDELLDAYCWLRNCENRLQAWADEQTHLIPTDPVRLSALAHAMHCRNGEELTRKLDDVCERVRAHFDDIFSSSDKDAGSNSFRTLWLNQNAEVGEYVEFLRGAGLPESEESGRLLHALRMGAYYRNLPVNAREKLALLLPNLIEHCLAMHDPGCALQRSLTVLESIEGRTTYLTLLAENAGVLQSLCRLCEASPWIAQALARQPILLDELIDPESIKSPPTRNESEMELERMLEEARGDTEREMEALRRTRQSAMLRIAAADVLGHMRLMVVSDHLTELAEVCVAASLNLAQTAIRQRYGIPRRPDGKDAEFAVVAFGKLGGIELGYGSDLDLVFLHDGAGGASDGERSLDNQTWFTRLGQRLIHLLSQPTAAGSAYEVDMRLRPSGASGLLVSDLALYQNYQLEKAWLWEHQALVRARFVAGSSGLGEQFGELRRRVLCQERDIKEVAEQVMTMRKRMRESLQKRNAGLFDLKQGPGGITDIEFLVQHLLLSYASEFPELVEFTDNIRQLEALHQAGLLDEAMQLAEIYRTYRRRRHALDLQEQAVLVADTDFLKERELVVSLWSKHVEDLAVT